MTQTVVLSSRVRLARNLKGLPFPNSMTAAQVQELIEKVDGAINGNKDFLLLKMKELPPRERQMLVERHLISPDLARSAGAALINKDETLSIMIGEEDHLRIQCMLAGEQLEKADELCAALDNALSRQLEYAFDQDLGYLTACPTNVGTGMRASMMVHLPALALAGQAEALLNAVSKLGYAIRGLYGEGSDAVGHIYQISNQMTLGMLEEDIIANLKATVRRVIDRENEVRKALYESNRMEVEDIVFRSLGILKYARKLDTREAMEHISNLKLGVGLDMLPDLKDATLNRLLITIQSASLQQRAGQALGDAQRDAARAKLLREELKEE